MKYPLEISTAPGAEPLTTQEAKNFFREDRSVEDSLIDQFVVASRKSLERHTGYHLIDTVFKMYVTGFRDVKIPKKPFKVGSLSIQYIDTNGATQTLATSKYTVHEQESPVQVEFLSDLPDLSDEDDDRYPVIITFTCGYGTASTNVPDDWKSVIGLIAMTYWVRKIPKSSFENFNPLNLGVVNSLLQDYRIGRFK